MAVMNLTGNQGKTLTVEFGNIASAVATKGVNVTKDLADQLVKAGVKFVDAAGNAIAPTVTQLTTLVNQAAAYCGDQVEGTVNQVKKLVDDAAQYCQDMGIKGKSTLEQINLFLKANGPSITVTQPGMK
jgi:hypothetical protein